MGGEDYVVDSRDAGFDQAEDRAVLLGGGVAYGVGDVDGGGAGLDGDGDHLEEELGVGAGAVLGGELDVFGEGAGEADRLASLVEGLVAGDAELALEMEVGGGEDDVDAVGGGGLDGAGGGLGNLLLVSAPLISSGHSVILILRYQSNGTISTNLRVALRGRASWGNALTFSFRGIWLAIPLKTQVPVGRVGIDSSVFRSI